MLQRQMKAITNFVRYIFTSLSPFGVANAQPDKKMLVLNHGKLRPPERPHDNDAETIERMKPQLPFALEELSRP